jgi:hypothetical protein
VYVRLSLIAENGKARGRYEDIAKLRWTYMGLIGRKQAWAFLRVILT